MTITVSVESFPLRLSIQNPKTGQTVALDFGVSKEGAVLMNGGQQVDLLPPDEFRKRNVAKEKT